MANEWYIGRNGSKVGPLSSAQVRQMVSRGEIGPADLIWKSGMEQWVPCSTVKGLFSGSGNLVPESSLKSVATNTSYADQSKGVRDLDDRKQSAGSLVYADFFPRVGAALLDGIFVGLMGCLPTIGVAVLVMVNAGNNPQDQDAAAAAINICNNLIALVVGCIYSVTLDSSSKQGTWGKQIMGLKVTDLSGHRISVGRAFGRFFARYLSACTCGIGFLLPLFTEKRQTLHELICGCLTLRK